MISWEHITEALRNELQEYGALLGLFEEQQANLLRRDADAVLALATSIEQQAVLTQTCRDHRSERVRTFASELHLPITTNLRQLVPHFPAEVQPLIEALLSEINHLIHRIRRDARHNHILLSRTVETHEEILRALRPDLFTKTYSKRGAVTLTTSAAGWQAAG